MNIFLTQYSSLNMSRISIELPSLYLFETVLEIRVGDLNYGMHLGNDAVLALVHEARIRFLETLGYTEFNIEGLGFLQIDAALQYKAQGKWGQKVKFQVALQASGSVGCDFFFLLTDLQTGKEMARVKTGMVFFDYAKQKIAIS